MKCIPHASNIAPKHRFPFTQPGTNRPERGQNRPLWHPFSGDVSYDYSAQMEMTPGAEALNPEQMEAVTAPEAPLLVLAGAGSGKTRVLTHRIAWLISVRGIEPWRIAGVTFTNKAAGEMRRRIDLLIGPSATGVLLHTFHALGVRLLREYGSAIGIPRGFTIFDDDDSESLVRKAMKSLGKTGDMPAEAVWSRISLAKSAGMTAEGFAQNAGGPQEELVARVFSSYEEEKNRSVSVDFDDLINLPTRLLTEHRDVAAAFHERVRHILVDEYQDTSPAQYQFLKAIAGPSRSITCVGDPDQSIYRWRGADIRNILSFEEDFPDARTVTLEQNYRSTGRILEAASGLISHNRRRKPKKLWTGGERGRPLSYHLAVDQESEARFVADGISKWTGEGANPGDFAILYRTHAQSRALEEALVRARIPYTVVGGVKFFARREVKDMLSYLRLLVNPADTVAFTRAIGAPPRGAGEQSVIRLIGASAVANRPVLDFISDPDALALFPSRARTAFAGFGSLIRGLADAVRERGWSEALAEAVEKSGYADWLVRQGGPEADDRLENLRELLNAARAAEDGGTGLPEYMEHAALLAGIDLWTGAGSGVTMMTLHNAKGLEFPHVVIPGMEEGLLPHASSIADEDELEEERRLFYVGLTRARESVVLTGARGRRTRERFSWSLPSRFLGEIPSGVVSTISSPLALPLPDDAPCDGVPPPERRREPVYEDAPSHHRERSYERDEPGEPDEINRPRLGAKVRHPKFGAGTVIQLSGAGDMLMVTVSFVRHGRKTLLAKMAHLEPL